MPATRPSYWKSKFDRTIVRDRKNIRKLRRMGWGVLVVWECQTRTAKLDILCARLRRFLGDGG